MKTQEGQFVIDRIIGKYQSLSKKEKSNINLGITLTLVIFGIGFLYNSGVVFGEFIHNLNH